MLVATIVIKTLQRYCFDGCQYPNSCNKVLVLVLELVSVAVAVAVAVAVVKNTWFWWEN